VNSKTQSTVGSFTNLGQRDSDFRGPNIAVPQMYRKAKSSITLCLMLYCALRFLNENGLECQRFANFIKFNDTNQTCTISVT
jgi:hypothetical protein